MYYRILKRKESITLLFLITGILLIILIGVNVWLQYEKSNSDARVYRSVEIQKEIKSLLLTLQDAETGQRGFLLTGKEEYLTPYFSSITHFKISSEKLKELVSNNAKQTDLLSKAIGLARIKYNKLERVIQLKLNGYWDEALIVIDSDQGKYVMDEIRDVINMMLAQEKIQLNIRQKESNLHSNTNLVVQLFPIIVIILMGSLIQKSIQLREQTEENLLVAKNEAESANNAKSDFLSRMSHELRTPLNAILGFSQLMEMDETLSKEQKDNIQEVMVAGKYLLELVNDVLDVVKSKEGIMSFNIEQIPVQHVLDECERIIELMAQKHNIIVSYEVTNNEMVCADKTRLKQALINLITNSIKYNRPNGSVNILCKDSNRNRILFEVCDTGMGIPKTMLDEIFMPFHRLDRTRYEVDGVGIGLSITKELIESMNGIIYVESEEGKGSTFTIDLPAYKGGS